MRGLVLLSVPLLLSTTAGAAAAAAPAGPTPGPATRTGDDGHGTAWTLEVQQEPGGDEPCDPNRFAREVELACDALGSPCKVSRGSAGASPAARHAVLHCGDESVLEARDAAGRTLWTVPIAGHAERTRRAAMWIARAGDGPPGGAEVEAAPLPPTEPASDARPALVPPRPPPVDAMDEPARRSEDASGLLLAARGTYLGGGFGPMLGARASAAVAVLAPNVAAYGAFAAGRTASGPMGFECSTGHLGAGLAWGAPWGTAPVGISLEAGAALGLVSAPPGLSPSTETFARFYGEAAATVQWGGRHAWRPFATLAAQLQSGSVAVQDEGVAEASVPWISASLDVGVAWRAW